MLAGAPGGLDPATTPTLSSSAKPVVRGCGGCGCAAGASQAGLACSRGLLRLPKAPGEGGASCCRALAADAPPVSRTFDKWQVLYREQDGMGHNNNNTRPGLMIRQCSHEAILMRCSKQLLCVTCAAAVVGVFVVLGRGSNYCQLCRQHVLTLTHSHQYQSYQGSLERHAERGFNGAWAHF